MEPYNINGSEPQPSAENRQPQISMSACIVRQVWEWKGDAEIKADVEDELFWSPYVDSEDITVKVNDGDVVLEGVATDWAEADTAVGNAFEGGARSVRARLELADGSKYVRYYAHDYDYYWFEHFYEDLSSFLRGKAEDV
jgi:osmotically-inducible protein OsmY